MDIMKMHTLTALEYRLLKFYFKVFNLVKYDNNDHYDIIWGDIHNEVDKVKEEIDGLFIEVDEKQ